MLTKICAIVFIFFDFSNYMSGNNHVKEPEYSEWKSLTTQSYEYSPISIDQILKNGSEIYLEFYVKAERDAHIIFSPTEEPAKEHEKSYEIVLGADYNKYSTIRLSRRGINTKQDFQHDIVSPDKWCKFWLRISSNRLIEVGKYGKLAFLSLEDKDHMNIDHFGFASWINNNSVDWQIKCCKNNTWTQSTHKTEEELKQDLFSKYGRTTPPKNSTLLDEVNITLTNQYAYGRKGALEIVVLAKITWKDDRLTWNSTYNNSNNIYVEHESIWKPNITIKNDRLCRHKSLNAGYVILTHEGIVSWVTHVHIKLLCSPKEHLKLSSQATCPIRLPYIAKKLNLEVQNNFEMPLPSPFFFSKVQGLKNEQPEFYAELIFKRRGQ